MNVGTGTPYRTVGESPSLKSLLASEDKVFHSPTLSDEPSRPFI